MIYIDDQVNLVLTPRAFAVDAGRNIVVPLKRAYVCPLCESLIKGILPTDSTGDHLVNLNPYTAGNEHTLIRPEYKNEFLKLPTGEALQSFQDENHCGEGLLQKRTQEAGGNRCKFVKFYFEPSVMRLFHRFLKDLRKLELYGGYVNNHWLSTHDDFLKAITLRLGDNPERIQLFLAHHPYGRFVPELTGQGPAGYLAMYRFEHTMLRAFYTKVIEGTHERIH